MIHRKMPRCLTALGLVALASTAIQCTSSRADFEKPLEAGAPDPFVSPIDAGDQGNDAGARECTGSNRLIYVLSRDPDAIARFDPETLTFTRLGYLACPVAGAFSMAIDRYNTAWVLFSSGRMVHVDLDDLRCREVALRNLATKDRVFGMGFASNDSDSGETLFLSNNGLYQIDPTKLEIEWVGQTRLPDIAELTGTGDGQLFGYTKYNGVIARLEKTSGATLEAHRTSAVTGGSWAFAQWGGDFWIFAQFGVVPSSSVVRYSPAIDESTVVVQETGIDIVGAGSSTCAPFKPVQ